MRVDQRLEEKRSTSEEFRSGHGISGFAHEISVRVEMFDNRQEGEQSETSPVGPTKNSQSRQSCLNWEGALLKTP